MAMVSAKEMPFEPNAEIREGAVTTLDLDTRWKENLAVRGRLVLDGKGAEGWTAVLDAAYVGDRPRTFEPVTLDAEGRFSAPAIPGPASLLLRSPAGGPVKRVIEWELLVGPDTAQVELNLLTGTVRGSVPEPGDSLRVFHQLKSGAVMIHSFVADKEGAYEVEGIPAGEIYLQRDGGRGWVTLAQPRLAAGETLTIE